MKSWKASSVVLEVFSTAYKKKVYSKRYEKAYKKAYMKAYKEVFEKASFHSYSAFKIRVRLPQFYHFHK